MASDWFGPLSDTVSWLMDAAGLTGTVEPARLEHIRDEFRQFDTLMSHERAQARGERRAHRRPEAG